MKSNKIPENKFKRMFIWTWRQKSKTVICPQNPSLDKKIVLVTGASRGIGLETVKGLLSRGAEVIILSRDKKEAKKITCKEVGRVHCVEIDLGKMETIPPAINNIENILLGRRVDILINNAGIALRNFYEETSKGYELTFAVNVLGHHILFKEFYKKELLAKNAQIIAITGDIYTLANDCTPFFKYKEGNGVKAYSRSKLGVMWWAFECFRLYPQYKVNIVHPGVVPMGLGANQNSIISRILGKILLSPKAGAQTTLFCATQENIKSGEYYHNILGKAILPKNDIALNKKLSSNFWHELERIYHYDYKN